MSGVWAHRRCNNDHRCRICSQSGHGHAQCPTPESDHCFYCKANHRTGNRSCPRKKKEQNICDYQDKYKIGRKAAAQMLDGGNVNETKIVTNSEKQINQHKIQFCEDEMKGENQQKRSVNPYLVLDAVTKHIGDKPDGIRSVGNSLLVTVKSHDMGSKLMLLKSMANQPCE